MTDNDESRPPEEAAPDDRPTEKSVPVSKLAQWLLWRGVPREDGKTTKVPYTADFDLGSHSDPSTWTTYAEAKRVLNTEGWAHGLGFVFTKSDPYCGLDFDDCFIDGKLHEYVASLIRRLDSYTEITPSGKGLHVIVKAKLPGPGKHITNAPWGGDFEIYDNHRYFTMSGAQFVGTPKAVNERQIVVDELCSELLPAKEATKSPSSSAERVRVDISDDRLLDLARKSKHGDEFSALFDRGDRSGYDSGSEADLALCTRLAFWTAGDPERIDKLFRQSALVGEKWGRDDYRDRTIEVAIDGCSTFFGQHQAEREETIERTAEGEAPDPSDNIRITPISAVTAEPVRWLWEGWWPLGAVSLMVGEPGCNKSTLCYDRAARLSQGTLSGSLFNQPSNILIASAEDAPTFTLRPRLEAAGADLDRASFLRLARGESEGDIQLPDELPQLRTSIERAKARLVIIDPLVSHLTSRVDSHRDQDIRKVLDPLSRIAIDLRCSIVCIVHTNKTPSGDFFMRVGGSIGITGAARSGLLVAVDPTEEDENTPMRLIFHGKSNLGPKQRPLKFEVQSLDLTPEISTARILWRGEAIGINQADALGGRRRDGYNPERNAARLWLKHLLEPKPDRSERVTVIRTEAHDSGHAWRTIERAKGELHIIANREGGVGNSGYWVWTLPEDTEPPPPPSPDVRPFLDPESANTPTHETVAALGENDPSEGTKEQVSTPIAKAAKGVGGVSDSNSGGGLSTDPDHRVEASDEEAVVTGSSKSAGEVHENATTFTDGTPKTATDEGIGGLKENRRSELRPPNSRGGLSDPPENPDFERDYVADRFDSGSEDEGEGFSFSFGRG